MNYVLTALLWSLYCALHSYLISIGFTNLMKGLLKKYYAFYRLLYVVFSFLLIIPLFKISASSNYEIITYPYTIDIIRQILLYGSLVMFGWAFFFDYDALSFFGIRQIMGFGKAMSPDAPEIKRKGLLGIIRHPMYLALIIFLWCKVFTLTDLIVNSVLTVYVIIGTILEERKLVMEFGEAYTKYQDEVPMLIPFAK